MMAFQLHFQHELRDIDMCADVSGGDGPTFKVTDATFVSSHQARYSEINTIMMKTL